MTRLTGPHKSLLLGMLTIVCVAQAPLPGHTEELSSQSDEALIPELELIKEEETVSIASRYEQPISQAPSNVYVITDEDIKNSGATDLPAVLRRIPGMEVMQITGADINVSMRGNNQLAANKLLVMIDGRSIYIDVQGVVFWKLIPVTLPEIERIEVLKGPASVLYGFNAFDGVINIITKSSKQMKGTTLQFGGGEYGTISSAAIQGGAIGKLGYRLSVGHDQNQQWQNRNALAFRTNKFNVQTEYALSSESKLLISGGLTDSNRFDGTVTSTVRLTETPALAYANAVYERPNFYVRAWWNGYNDTYGLNVSPLIAPFLKITDTALSPTSVIRANTYNAEAQHTIDLSAADRFTYGINYRMNTLSNNFIDQRSNENRLGFYLQNEWKATPTLTLMAGARYELNTFIHATISPRLSLLYSPIPDHTFRVTTATGYRPPTLFETHLHNLVFVTLPPPSPPLPPVFSNGSNNLDPEKIFSIDAGYQGWYFKHRLRTRADVFYNHITDLIQFIGSGGGVSQGGIADIYGGEAGMEFLVTRWLSAFANSSFEEIHQTFTGDARRGAPRFKWNLGVRGDWANGLNSEIVFYHVGSATYPVNQAFFLFAPLGGFTPPNERVGSYNLLNLRMGYKFWQQKAEAGYMRDAELAISAFNALNDKHKEHPLGDTIGSRVMGWMTVRY
ncbi:MAG TPA: TonB-dependent receptor [Nitrospiraceae bacterium]|jgi:iron complex outermembrane receptor protein|nr:TonB-dependent receptor [Nitrospiraceae bacterium]